MTHSTEGSSLRAFREYQGRRNFSERTIECRAAVLLAFSRWLGRRSLLRASAEDIEAWLSTRRLGPQATYTYLAHLHAFFAFAVKAGFTAHDPTIRIERPRLPRRLPRPIPPHELAEAAEFADDRMLAWLYLGGYEGLRAGEIAALCREDIWDHTRPPMLRVHGKGDKEALLPLHPAVLAALVRYGMPRSGPLFRRKDGSPLQRQDVGRHVAAYLRSLGIDRTAHALRHHFGTQAYRNCHDLVLTRSLMRHASSATTEAYVAFDPGPATDVVRRIGGSDDAA